MKSLFESFLFCSLGLFGCFFLQKEFELSPILSSSVIGFVGSFIPNLSKFDSKQAINSVYVGTFSAMGASVYYFSSSSLIILCLLTSLSFYLFNSYGKTIGQGFGGRLGTIAFVASLVFMFLGKVL